MRRALLCFLIALCFFGQWAFGWAVTGHRAISMIAESLLRQSGGFQRIQPILGNFSLAEISTCADEVRAAERDPSVVMAAACRAIFPDPPKGTAGWHFVDTPYSSEATDADIRKGCGDACVLTEIERFRQVLADNRKAPRERLQALAWVVHFVEDIHQPLHAIERNSDRGGNAEQVEYDGQVYSLHYVWDELLAGTIAKTPESLADILALDIATVQREENAHATKPADWAVESFRLARNTVYTGIPDADPKNPTRVVAVIDSSYRNRAIPVVRKQLARAAVRLANFIQDNTRP